MTDETKPEAEPQAAPAEPPPKFGRIAVVLGAILGAIIGAALTYVITMPMEADRSAFPVAARRGAKSDGGAAARDGGARVSEPMNPSYAQQGEDLVMLQMLVSHGVTRPTYVDVGAHEPVRNNNTYMFYKLGGDGVLVEPNPVFAAQLRAARPRDTVLEVGVGVADENEADYYVLDGDGQLNTFSKKQADTLVNLHHHKVLRTMKRKLVKLNEILEQHFKQGSPHVLSVDTEGLDYEILKSVDWKRWRPMIVCAETSDTATGAVEQPILDLMRANGYSVRGGSYVNTIFLDDEAESHAPAVADGGARK